jgi:hypothetical protein
MVIGDDGLDHGKLPREDQAGIESVDSRRHTASLFHGSRFIKFSIMRFHAVSRPQHDTTSVLAFPMRQALDPRLGHASTFIPSTLAHLLGRAQRLLCQQRCERVVRAGPT